MAAQRRPPMAPAALTQGAPLAAPVAAQAPARATVAMKLDGPKAKDGQGHCPTMLFMKGESHMSAVFSIDTADKVVSGPVLDFIKKTK